MASLIARVEKAEEGASTDVLMQLRDCAAAIGNWGHAGLMELGPAHCENDVLRRYLDGIVRGVLTLERLVERLEASSELSVVRPPETSGATLAVEARGVTRWPHDLSNPPRRAVDPGLGSAEAGRLR